MNSSQKMFIWSGAAAFSVLAAAAAYVAVNMRDAEPPDIAKYVNALEIPADGDNVYCGLVAASKLTDGQSGVPILTKVFEDHSKTLSLSKEILSGAGKASGEEMSAIMSESAAVIAAFREACGRRAWYARSEPSGERVMFPDISTFVKLSALPGLQALWHAEAGRTGEAVGLVADMLRLARTVENDAESMMRWIVTDGTLVNTSILNARSIVATGKATDDELAGLADAFRAYDVGSIRGRAERMFNNELTVVFAGLTSRPEEAFLNGSSVQESDGLTVHVPFRALLPYAFHRNRTQAVYIGCLEKMRGFLRAGYDRSAWNTLEDWRDAELEGSLSWRFGPNYAGIGAIYATMPIWSSFARSIAATEFEVRSTETVIAAELFRRRNGARPERLEDLVPAYLPAVPRDPFAPKESIRYDAGRGVLWTVGEDGDFDGDDSRFDEDYQLERRHRGHIAWLAGRRPKQ